MYGTRVIALYWFIVVWFGLVRLDKGKAGDAEEFAAWRLNVERAEFVDFHNYA
jgi:hypothetical protein